MNTCKMTGESHDSAAATTALAPSRLYTLNAAIAYPSVTAAVNTDSNLLLFLYLKDRGETTAEIGSRLSAPSSGRLVADGLLPSMESFPVVLGTEIFLGTPKVIATFSSASLSPTLPGKTM